LTILVAEATIAAAPHPTTAVLVRPATEDDVAAIVRIVAENARQGHLLPRSAENIRASLPTWLVAEVDGQVVGIGSLLAMTPALAEVRSLAVLPTFRSHGVGAAIVLRIAAEARRQHYPTLFALTRAVGFFQKLGFVVTGKERFPEKVWRDCVLCPLQQRCDETAVVMEL
jgi:amino-acid N-acetyltransferase